MTDMFPQLPAGTVEASAGGQDISAQLAGMSEYTADWPELHACARIHSAPAHITVKLPMFCQSYAEVSILVICENAEAC